MKDKVGVQIVKEFVRLRGKNYSYLKDKQKAQKSVL